MSRFVSGAGDVFWAPDGSFKKFFFNLQGSRLGIRYHCSLSSTTGVSSVPYASFQADLILWWKDRSSFRVSAALLTNSFPVVI